MKTGKKIVEAEGVKFESDIVQVTNKHTHRRLEIGTRRDEKQQQRQVKRPEKKLSSFV